MLTFTKFSKFVRRRFSIDRYNSNVLSLVWSYLVVQPTVKVFT